MTNQEFINLLSKKIDNIKDFPVLKSLAIAQACLESQYGRKHFYNNLFGIKCHDPKKYAGCRLGRTAEFIDGSYKNLSLAFQTYNSFDESLEDYARLMNIPRYKPVREAKNYLEATEQIVACGYATSPSYRDSLRKIIEQYKLYELDNKYEFNFRGENMKLEVLKPGSKGGQVRWVQEILMLEYGYPNEYKNPFDGQYGNFTKEQVLKYQKDKGLAQDGIVGIVGIETTLSLLFDVDMKLAEEKYKNTDYWFKRLVILTSFDER